MFNKNKRNKDGLGTECRPCANAYSKKYHDNNVERHKERMRERYRADPERISIEASKWRLENPEKARAAKKAWAAANREKLNAASRASWVKHHEKNLARKKRYREQNPERGAEHVRARQTRKQKAMPMWADRSRILEIYRECKRISAETGIKHHVDHYFPLKSDVVCGLHVEHNLRIIPASENHSKGNKLPE
jgi:hypothetical protein